METTDVVMHARNWAITHIEEMAKMNPLIKFMIDLQ